jgi:hypothetical protein
MILRTKKLNDSMMGKKAGKMGSYDDKTENLMMNYER